MSIAGLLLATPAQAQTRANGRGAESPQAAENATKQPDWVNQLRAEVDKLNLQVAQLKEQNQQLSQKLQNLEGMTTKTALRVTVLEPQTVKLTTDFTKLTSDFKNHTHSLSGGIVNGNAVPWGNQGAMAGYYFVIGSKQGISSLSKPIVP